MSKSLSKEQIEAVFAKFDSNKVLKLLHIDIAHNRGNETQFHEGWETEQGGVQELDGKQKIINSGIFARNPEQLVRIFEDRWQVPSGIRQVTSSPYQKSYSNFGFSYSICQLNQYIFKY